MAPIPPLFSLPITSDPTNPKSSESKTAKGSVIVTQSLAGESSESRIYLVSFSSPPDNRLTPDFNATLSLALDLIEQRLPRGVVVTTSSITKFYSNGLDFDSAIATPGFFERSFYPLLRRLLSYPMPTVALLPGHAFAGGLMLAMAHDYRIMNPAKGYLCLNEVDFGAPLRPPMAGIFRLKLAPQTCRSLALEARRFSGKDALSEGIVDVLGGYEEAEKLIVDRKLTDKGKSGVYGVIKEELYREEIAFLDAGDEAENKDCSGRAEATDRLNDQARERVEMWEENGGRIAGKSSAKL